MLRESHDRPFDVAPSPVVPRVCLWCFVMLPLSGELLLPQLPSGCHNPTHWARMPRPPASASAVDSRAGHMLLAGGFQKRENWIVDSLMASGT